LLKRFLKASISWLGAGVIGTLLGFLSRYLLPCFGFPDSHPLVQNFWKETFWLSSYCGVLVASAVYLGIRTRSAKRIRDKATELIASFRFCSTRERAEVSTETDIYYWIGRRNCHDRQDIYYTISVPAGGSPVKARHLFLGNLTLRESTLPFDLLLEMHIESEDVTPGIPDDARIMTKTIPYELSPQRTHIALCFTPSIQPGETCVIRVRIERPKLWKPLRKTGSDSGKYTPGLDKPQRLSLRFVPPRGLTGDDFSISPTNELAELHPPSAVVENDARSGKGTLVWNIPPEIYRRLDACTYELKCAAMKGNILQRGSRVVKSNAVKILRRFRH
jgi:hypothetical protein